MTLPKGYFGEKKTAPGTGNITGDVFGEKVIIVPTEPEI